MGGMTKRRKAQNRLLRALMYICSGATCALLVFIIGYILVRGVPNLSWQLVSGDDGAGR